MTHLTALALLPLGLALSGGPLQGENLPRLLTLEGFAAPECVVVDPDSGMAYVSNMATPPETYWEDTGQGFISRLGPDGTLDTLRWVDSTDAFVIHQPNGMAIHDGKLYAGSWTLHEIFEISLTGTHPPTAFGLQPHFTNLDGIEQMPDGTFIVSDFSGNRVAAVSADRQQVKTLYELTTPADIGIDLDRLRLYVPQLQSDRVVVISLAPRER